MRCSCGHLCGSSAGTGIPRWPVITQGVSPCSLSTFSGLPEPLYSMAANFQKPQRASACLPSACFTNVPLAKKGHTTKPRVSVRGAYPMVHTEIHGLLENTNLPIYHRGTSLLRSEPCSEASPFTSTEACGVYLTQQCSRNYDRFKVCSQPTTHATDTHMRTSNVLYFVNDATIHSIVHVRNLRLPP